MQLLDLVEDDDGWLVFQVDDESVGQGNIFNAIRAKISHREYCQSLTNIWSVKATHANIQILGTLIPGFTARLGALRAQLSLF